VTFKRCHKLAVQPATKLVPVTSEELGLNWVDDPLHSFPGAQRQRCAGVGDGLLFGNHLLLCALVWPGIVVGYHDRNTPSDRLQDGAVSVQGQDIYRDSFQGSGEVAAGAVGLWPTLVDASQIDDGPRL
jgi:hypothetical protein